MGVFGKILIPSAFHEKKIIKKVKKYSEKQNVCDDYIRHTVKFRLHGVFRSKNLLPVLQNMEIQNKISIKIKDIKGIYFAFSVQHIKE